MTKFLGKLADFGTAVEGTRGTAESSANYWFPKASLSIDDQVDQIEDGNSVGVIEDVADVDEIREFAEGDMEGPIEVDSFGEILLGTLGSVSTSTDSPEAGVNTHTFTVDQSSTHQALTLFIQDPNQSYTHANGVIDSLTIDAVLDDYAMFTAGLMAQSGSTASGLSPSYSDNTRFRPQHITLETASSISNLDDSGYTDVQELSIEIEKNVEPDNVLNNNAPRDFLNTQFSVTGNLTLIMDDETFKTEYLGNTAEAYRITMLNDGVTVSGSTSPEVQIDLDDVKVTDFARNYDNDSIVTADVEFKATYNLSNSSMISIDLVNAVSSY